MYGKNRIPGREACTMIFWLVWLDWQAWKREFSTALESQQKKNVTGTPSKRKKKSIQMEFKKKKKKTQSSLIVNSSSNLLKINQKYSCEHCTFVSGYLCVWHHGQGCQVCVTSWVNLFPHFTGEKWTTMTAPWETQIGSKTLPLLHKY